MKLPASQFARLKAQYHGRPVLVTGGAGFIGGHLLDALLSLGASICILDDLSNSTVDHVASLMDLEPRRVRFIHGSVLDDDALLEGVQRGATGAGSRIVFHLAAIGSVPRSMLAPQRTWSVNATGAVRVLAASAVKTPKGAAVERVVLASSSSVYGDQSSGRLGEPVAKVETMLPNPLSPYAASKLAAEAIAASWSQSYGLSTVSLRYFNVFGPRQSADSDYAAVIPAMTTRLLNGQPVVIYGDGRQGRDFTHVGNVVLATLLAGVADRAFKGEAINIGTGSRTTVLELAEQLSRACDVHGRQPEFRPERAGDVRDSMADISRARELLGFEPATSLQAGLDETVAWFKQETTNGRLRLA